MRKLIALTIDTVPSMPDDKGARRCILEYDDGSYELIGSTPAEMHRLTQELFLGREWPDLPLRLAMAVPKPTPMDATGAPDQGRLEAELAAQRLLRQGGDPKPPPGVKVEIGDKGDVVEISEPQEGETPKPRKRRRGRPRKRP